jgi:catechol 2,3-dioxygenase-like lactoylglutathione lyase family enzyme
MQFSLKTKITTSLFQESVDFYRQIFGMVVMEEWDHADDKGSILGFTNGAGEALLEIYYGEELHEFTNLSLQFKVQDLSKFIDQLPSTVERSGPKPRPWGAMYLYLDDPNNIPIIVYEGCL